MVLESAAVGTPMVASDVPGALFIAESLSSVQTLSLHEPDTVWAAALERSLGVRGDTLLRQERAQEFAQSEFALAQATRRYEALYGEGGDK